MRSLIASIGVGGCGAVVAALLARREATARVTDRQVGMPLELQSFPNALDVGDGIWRGPAPTVAGYQELADLGCSLIIDLRSEADHQALRPHIAAAGLDLFVLPTNNTRPPANDHVDQFAAARQETAGATYVHCEAGEGRTGAIVGAFAVRAGTLPASALADALAVGSLTFSQLLYIASGARLPLVPAAIDWCVDRPTEVIFNLLRRSAK